jgi:hypothetical protein
VDLGAQPLPARDRGVGTEALGGLDGAVEGDPGHHLGVGELAPRAAHLPDALVGLAPGGLEVVHQGDLAAPDAAVDVTLKPRGRVSKVHHLSVDVELELVGGGVADAHG